MKVAATVVVVAVAVTVVVASVVVHNSGGGSVVGGKRTRVCMCGAGRMSCLHIPPHLLEGLLQRMDCRL